MASIEAKATHQSDRAVGDLSGILLAGLKALAEAGEAEQACRLARHACAALRHGHTAEWRGFNTLLHRLSRRAGPLADSGPRLTKDRRKALGVVPAISIARVHRPHFEGKTHGSKLAPLTQDRQPQEGFELAAKLARVGVKLTQPSAEVRDKLRADYAQDAAQLIASSQVIALHFQTVAAANAYWRD